MPTKQTWRLLIDEISDPFMHFAVEEALLRTADEETGLPVLRMRQTEPSVWIGYYQNPYEDVDVAYCKKNKLKIVRRLNSGGAVYQDYGTFCYSAFFNKKDFLSSSGLKHTDELYRLFGNVIIELCKLYGIKAELSPVNDITVDNRKIYGSAQLDWYSAFMHSGSILVNADLNKMQHTLKPSDLKFADKGLKNLKERVVNMLDLAQIPSIDQIKKDFIASFAKSLEVEFVEQGLTARERELAGQLYTGKYAKHEWTYTVSKPHTTVVSTKIPGGVMTLKCSISEDEIHSASLSGDFLIASHQSVTKVMKDIEGESFKRAVEIIKRSGLSDDISVGLVHLIKQLSN